MDRIRIAGSQGLSEGAFAHLPSPLDENDGKVLKVVEGDTRHMPAKGGFHETIMAYSGEDGLNILTLAFKK
jgi:hypothetical protein